MTTTTFTQWAISGGSKNMQMDESKAGGFSLIEMMIVVVVIAVLAAIAIPIYQQQIRESRRTSAKTALLDLASREEKFYATNNYYTMELNNLGYSNLTGNTLVVPGNGENYYTVQFPASASTQASSYTAEAVPYAGSTQASDQCYTYSITDLGVQTNTGGTQTTNCW